MEKIIERIAVYLSTYIDTNPIANWKITRSEAYAISDEIYKIVAQDIKKEFKLVASGKVKTITTDNGCLIRVGRHLNWAKKLLDGKNGKNIEIYIRVLGD